MDFPIKKTDVQIQRDVIDELKWDTRVRGTDVGVEVSSGVATRSAIEHALAVRGTPGVQTVDSQLRVHT